MDLAERAGIGAGQVGRRSVLLHGGGNAVPGPLPRRGADARRGRHPAVVGSGRQRCAAEGLADRITFTLADACRTGLPPAQFDFVWGEDAWCYVVDKPALIAEAARLVKPRRRSSPSPTGSKGRPD